MKAEEVEIVLQIIKYFDLIFFIIENPQTGLLKGQWIIYFLPKAVRFMKAYRIAGFADCIMNTGYNTL